MTMIACVLNKSAPVVVSDLLISGSNKPDEFLIPTIPDDVLQFLESSNSNHPVWLSQKVYVLKENVCVIFSGSVFYIKQFLEDIRLFCNIQDEVNPANLNIFLKEHEADESWKHISFAVLLANEDGGDLNLGIFKHGQWVYGSTSMYGEIWASGSGAQSFLEEAAVNATLDTTYGDDNVNYVMQTNIIMLSRLMARERATQHTIKKHWGAGFEMVYYNKGKFCKLSEVTFIINQGHLNQSGIANIPVPVVILHYKYQDELLIITAVSPQSGQTEETDTHYIISSKDFRFRQFIVAPMDHRTTDGLTDLPIDPSFKSHYNAMAYILETESSYYLPASFNIGSELQVEYKHQEIITITMMKAINDRLVSLAKETFL